MNNLVLLTEDGSYNLSQCFLKGLCSNSSNNIKLILSQYFDVEAQNENSPGDGDQHSATKKPDFKHLPDSRSGIKLCLCNKYYEAEVNVCHLESCLPSYLLTPNVRVNLLGDCDSFVYICSTSGCEGTKPEQSALGQFLACVKPHASVDDGAEAKYPSNVPRFGPNSMIAIALPEPGYNRELSEKMHDAWDDFCITYGIDFIVASPGDSVNDLSEKHGFARAADVLHSTDWSHMDMFASTTKFLDYSDAEDSGRVDGASFDAAFQSQLDDPERVQVMRALLFEKKNDIRNLSGDPGLDVFEQIYDKLAAIKELAKRLPDQSRRDLASRAALAMADEIFCKDDIEE